MGFLIPCGVNFLLILLLLTLSELILVFLGLFFVNKYFLITINRLLSVFYVKELMLFISVGFIVFLNKSLCFSNFLLISEEYAGFFFLNIFSIYLLIFFLFDLHRAPFDFLEAESEVVMGYTIELTGY